MSWEVGILVPDTASVRCNRKFLLPEKNYSRSQNFPGKKDSRSNHFLGKYESPMEIITPLYFCRIYFLSDGSVFFPVNHYSSGAKYEVRSVRFAPHQNPDQIYWRSTLIFFYKYSKDIWLRLICVIALNLLYTKLYCAKKICYQCLLQPKQIFVLNAALN